MPMESRGTVPIPDPTKLTTDAVNAAKAELEKLYDVKLAGLREFFSEKFDGVNMQFTMRDIALAAALKAAQEAVKQQNESNTLAIDKAGAAFTKQIDGLNEKIDDLKARLAEVIGKNWATVGAYIVGALGIAALIAATLIKH